MLPDEIRDLAIASAVAAGQTALDFFHRAELATGTKTDDSLFSEADTAAERLIVSRVAAAFPAHPVIGEESIAEQSPGHFAAALDAEYTWVIDPIDGTNNFLAGNPIWCVAIAVLHHGTPVLGVIYFPALGDELFVSNGAGVTVRKNPAGTAFQDHPAPTAQPKTPGLFMADDTFFRRFRFDRPHVPRILGCTVLNLLYVVLGRAQGAVTGAHLWDFAAPLAIAAARDIDMVGLQSSRPYRRFTVADFHLDPAHPKHAWRIKEDCLVAPRADIAKFQSSLHNLGDT